MIRVLYMEVLYTCTHVEVNLKPTPIDLVRGTCMYTRQLIDWRFTERAHNLQCTGLEAGCTPTHDGRVLHRRIWDEKRMLNIIYYVH